MSNLTLKLIEFSKYPFGRYRSESNPNSGERFREEFLKPSLEKAKDGIVTVVLDGAKGYSSSFLEEAFGGLVRAGFSSDDLRRRLDIVSADIPSLITEIWQYVDEAQKEAHKQRIPG